MNDILQYKGYFAEVHFSGDDDVFFGKILGINDLVSFEGTTVKELKKAFQEAVEDYLETCKALNKEPDKAYKGSFNVRITPELHRQAANISAIRQMTLNEFVGFAINYAISASVSQDGKLRTIMMLLTILLPASLAGFLFLRFFLI